MVKLTLGSFGDCFSTTSLKAYLAEFNATSIFVFAGVGSAIAFGKDDGRGGGTPFHHPATPV
ncbi:hypothetical protein CsatB_019487 [Cannabis sativa]